jgi:hypothetical protein
MGHLRLLASPTAVSGFQSLWIQTRDDGRDGFIDEYVHVGGNTRSTTNLC